MTQKGSTSYCDLDPLTSFNRYRDLASRLSRAVDGVIGAFCIYESLRASTGGSGLSTSSIIIYLCPALANIFATSSSFRRSLACRIRLSLSLSDLCRRLCLTSSFHYFFNNNNF